MMHSKRLSLLFIVLYGCTETPKVTMFYDDGGKKAEFHVKRIIPELNTHHIGHLLYQRDSLIVGKYLLYHENGHVWQKAHFNDEGLMNGKVYYYYKDGALKNVQLYKNGLLWDVLEYRDSIGNELSVGDFKDGSGELIEYYPDGSMSFIKHYKNGEPSGLWMEFFPNGNVKSETYYDKGVRTERKVYNEDGNLIKEIDYDD